MDVPEIQNVNARFRSLSSIGDLNNDAMVDLADLIIGLKELGGVPTGQVRADFWQADVNEDDRVDLGDMIFMLQVISEIRGKSDRTDFSIANTFGGLACFPWPGLSSPGSGIR
jgi:hypothetical protein